MVYYAKDTVRGMIPRVGGMKTLIDIYCFVLLILELVVVVCGVLVGRKKGDYTADLLRMYAAGLFAVFFNILYMQSADPVMAKLFYNFFYIGVDGAMIFMTRFILKYTKTQVHTKFFDYFIWGYATLDTASLLTNNVTDHMFVLERAMYNGEEYWRPHYFPLHYTHMGFCAILAIFTIIVLVNRLLRSPKPYKKMYWSILVVFWVILLVNLICYIIVPPIDVPSAFYALLAIAFCFLLVYASPKGLVESILANVVEDIDNGIVCFDFSGNCIYANTKAKALLEVEDDKVSDIQDAYYVKWIRNHLPDSVDYEYWDREYTVEGESHHFHIEFQRLKDTDNSTIGYFYKLTDKTAEMKAFQEGQYLATHDRLTGLYTKDYFFQKAEEIIKRSPEKERYMVCAQIKNFQVLNDLFGEEMSDKILVAQAALMKFSTIEDCIQGRISGEKFAMLITKENFNAEMTVKNLGRLHYMIDGRNYKLNIAMGVYNITDPDEDPQEMFEKASMAVETQDNDYQKTVVYYDNNLIQQIMQEREMADEFESAIKSNQFRMFLQPQMNADGKMVGAEALARWQHPQRGLIFPVDFLAVVEKTRLISLLDEYMWKQAAEKLREWKDQGYTEATISVNVSAKDFYYIDIYETLVDIVKKYEIDPSKMNLEIAEIELLSDTGPQIKELRRLQEFGFSIQIDDFGEGYSSLNLLQSLQASILKVDIRLLEHIPDETKMKKILNAIFTMVRSLDMQVITESVETEEQVEMLKELGCEMFQGYYFSRPIPVEEFEEKYLKAN